MNIGIFQIESAAGNFDFNTRSVFDSLQNASQNNVDVAIFSANNLCGFPLYESVLYKSFRNQLTESINRCLSFNSKTPFIVGTLLPIENEGLQMALLFIYEQKVEAVITKKHLSHNETKYCQKGSGVQFISHQNKTFAIGFQEDYLDILNSSSQNVDYVFCFNNNYFIGIESVEKQQVLAKEIATKLNAAIFAINMVGSSVPFLYAGGSFVYNKLGQLLYHFPFFEETVATINIHNLNLNPIQEKSELEISLAYKALVMGIKSYFSKNKFTKVVLGLSGGIDSALVAAIAVAALGNENVTGILMPSEFSSDHSVNDALALAKNLNIESHIVPIKSLYSTLNAGLSGVFNDTLFGLAEENMQARLRGVILMAVSNKTNAILLNTSNKSEVAVGYGTLYGDMCGALAPLGDLYKTEVFKMAEWINRNEEIIPWNTIKKAPSAELRPNQLDSDSLPDYSVLDKILFLFLENEKSKEELIALGFDEKIVSRTLHLVNCSEYKRRQSAPILKITPKTFGIDVKFPID